MQSSRSCQIRVKGQNYKYHTYDVELIQKFSSSDVKPIKTLHHFTKQQKDGGTKSKNDNTNISVNNKTESAKHLTGNETPHKAEKRLHLTKENNKKDSGDALLSLVPLQNDMSSVQLFFFFWNKMFSSCG